jgi:hypothetical protein
MVRMISRFTGIAIEIFFDDYNRPPLNQHQLQNEQKITCP